MMCLPEFTRTAADKGKVVWVLPSSNWKASLLEAFKKTEGKSLVPGSMRKRCLISLPSQVKLTTPVDTSTKQPTKSPVEGGFPEGSLDTSAYISSTRIM